MMGLSFGEVGNVLVATTTGRGHSPEELADLALGKIINVSGEMPPEIRDQVLAFKEKLRYILTDYIARGQQSERTTMIAALEKEGHSVAAEIVRRL
jgi:hypothetical protein